MGSALQPQGVMAQTAPEEWREDDFYPLSLNRMFPISLFYWVRLSLMHSIRAVISFSIILCPFCPDTGLRPHSG